MVEVLDHEWGGGEPLEIRLNMRVSIKEVGVCRNYMSIHQDQGNCPVLWS